MQSSISAASLQTDFLQLFITQVQNQNPLEPIEQENFLSQLAQFSMVEGIEDMKTGIDALKQELDASSKLSGIVQGIDLVGKGVSFVDPQTDGTNSGTVDEIHIFSDGLFAEVNGENVSLANISSVFQV